SDGSKCLDPALDDTDKDCITDKDEVRRSVFAEKTGWAWTYKKVQTNGTARDADGHGTPPELTLKALGDSDRGGVPDYVEDLDRDDVKGPGETDPFRAKDDTALVEGSWEQTMDKVDSGFTIPNYAYSKIHVVETTKASYKLAAKPDGTMSGAANVVKDRFVTY